MKNIFIFLLLFGFNCLAQESMSNGQFSWSNYAHLNTTVTIENSVSLLLKKYPHLDREKLHPLTISLYQNHRGEYPTLHITIADTTLIYYGEEQIEHFKYYVIKIPSDGSDNEVDIGFYEGAPYTQIQHGFPNKIIAPEE